MDSASNGAALRSVALGEGEARLRLALDVAQLGTWSFSLGTGAGTLDERAAQIVGLPVGDFTDVAAAQAAATHPDDLPGLQRAIELGIASREPFELTYRVIHQNGSVRHVASRAVALLDAAGHPAVLVGTNRDVTADRNMAAERERMLAETENALADADLARRRLEAVVEHLPVGVTLAEAPSGRLLVSNAAVRRIWGLDTSAASVSEYSAHYIGFRPGDGPESERQYGNEDWPLARTLANGERVNDEVVEIQWPDGSRRMVSVSTAPVHNAAGTLVGGVVMTQDVHERQQLLLAERAARARTERLQELTAALAGARTMDEVATVVVADMVQALGARTGALAVVAPEGDALVLLRTVGFPEPLPELVRRQALGLRSPLTECFLTEAPVWLESRDGVEGLDHRYPLISAVWDRLSVQSAAFVPLTTGGEVVGVISFAFDAPRVFDVGERSFLEALGQQAALAVERARLFGAERTARAEAERANRAKSEFLAVMSHELRTPLNAIDGYAELMELGIRGPLTNEQRHDLARIRRSERHLLGLINGVLNYAQVEAGAAHFEAERVAVDDILSTCEALSEPQAQSRGISLQREPSLDGLCAWADREKAQQVMLNLVSNAVKFTGSGGAVRLRSARDRDPRGEWACIVVQDSGIGIPADQQARVFEPFVQIDGGLTRAHEGTGLGLAISRDLARGMGGELTVESTVGEGSTFTLRLPIAR